MITQAEAALVRATARRAFFEELQNPPDSMAFIFPHITTRVESDSDQETYPWLGQVPQLQEWQSVRAAKGLPTQSFSITNKKWEATLAVENDLVRRDKLGMVATRARDLGRRAAAFTERLLIDRLLEGESTTCYDGQFFFDTDHADAGAVYTTSQDNDLTSAAATGTAPTVAEFESAVDTVLQTMRTYKDDQGEPWNFAEDLHWLVPPAYQKVASMVLGDGNGISAADATGSTGAFRGLGTVHVSPYLPARQTAKGLTTDNRFYCFNAAPVIKPLILQVEKDAEFESLGPGSDHSFKTDTTLFGVLRIFNIGYGPWQHAIVHTFT